jgi:hypothetical protein
MKTIINMKRYDTATAEEIASWWNGCSRNDFNYCAETLYRTASQSWFLHGEGGPLSKYAQSVEGGRGTCGGETIVPLTEAAAAEWLAEHEPSVFEKYFAHRAQNA